ncbi:MAG: hypothetical protein J1E64_02250 [Acetatifactor sp.]|nr:hypothetical protein [Acetatifactor sp.]
MNKSSLAFAGRLPLLSDHADIPARRRELAEQREMQGQLEQKNAELEALRKAYE